MQAAPSRDKRPPAAAAPRSEFVDALQKGLLCGLALLVLVVPPIWVKKHNDAERQAHSAALVIDPAQPRPAMPVPAGVRLADFRGEDPSADARLVANWVVHTANATQHAFVLVDKKDARVYVFGPDGRLRDSAPALLGAARGDDSFPGIGEKPLEAVLPEEKTTPAGRYKAEPGLNANLEDVVWVDYDVAVSMHRIRPLVAQERRLERLATLATDDNRISFGCINLPVAFYEDVLSPAVKKHGAIVYVLPEVRTPQQVFGAWDVTDPAQLAAARPPATGTGVQNVSLQAR